IAPGEKDAGDLRHAPPARRQPEQKIPILRPPCVAPSAHRLERLAAEGRAGVHQRRLDETGRLALFGSDHGIQPGLEAGEARPDRAIRSSTPPVPSEDVSSTQTTSNGGALRCRSTPSTAASTVPSAFRAGRRTLITRRA